MNYVEIDGKPVVEPDILKWAEWCKTADRRVALTRVGKKEVSTVFLGLDHQFGKGPSLLYETMVFAVGSYDDLECQRYTTREQAMAGHEAVVERLRSAKTENP